MTKEEDKKDLKNVRDKIQENIKEIINSEFGDELTFEFGDELTFYPPWGHYETLGKVDIGGELKDMINPPFDGTPGQFFKQNKDKEMESLLNDFDEMLGDVLGKSINKNTKELSIQLKAWRNVILAKQIKDSNGTFTQETVDVVGLVMGMTKLIKMLKDELE